MKFGGASGNTNAQTYRGNYKGGSGGYSVGTITLLNNDKIYIYIGGQGKTTTASGWDTISGGFNGGGTIKRYTNAAGSGGGSSDIRINTDSLYSRIIVAGGGGGAGRDSSGNYGGGIIGGGLEGYSTGTIYGNSQISNIAPGGTQIGGGNAYGSSGSNYYSSIKAGGFGFGGEFYSNHTHNTATGGGGSGWYGGGVSAHYGRRWRFWLCLYI